MLPIYFCVWASHWRVGNPAEATPINKTDSPSTRSQQQPTVPQLGLGHMNIFPPHARMLTGLILSRSYAGHYQSIREVVLLCPEDIVLLLSSLTSGCYNLSAFPLKWSLSLGVEEIKMFYLLTSTPLTDNYSLYFDICGFSDLTR